MRVQRTNPSAPAHHALANVPRLPNAMAIRVPGAQVAAAVAAVAVPAPDPRARMRRANGPAHAAPIAVAELHVLPSVVPEDPATTNAAAQAPAHAVVAAPHRGAVESATTASVQVGVARSAPKAGHRAMNSAANAAAPAQARAAPVDRHRGAVESAPTASVRAAVARSAPKAVRRAMNSGANAARGALVHAPPAAAGAIVRHVAKAARSERNVTAGAKDRAARVVVNPSAPAPTARDHRARSVAKRTAKKARLPASCA